MTVFDSTTNNTFPVPANVVSLWIEIWGSSGYYPPGASMNGGYAEGDYACTPGEVLTFIQSHNGYSVSNTGSISAPSKGVLISATSGWDSGTMDGGDVGYGILTANVTNGSTLVGSNPDDGHARVTYTVSSGPLTSVSTTRVISWDVLKSVVINRTVFWDIQERLQDVFVTKSLSWDVFANVSVDRGVVWDVNSNVTATRDVLWDILTSVQLDRRVLWDISIQIKVTRTGLWIVESNFNPHNVTVKVKLLPRRWSGHIQSSRRWEGNLP